MKKLFVTKDGRQIYRKNPDVFRIEWMQLVPYDPSKRFLIPKQFARFTKEKCCFAGQSQAHKDMINTKERLATHVRRVKGYGKWMVRFFNYQHKNKSFNNKFVCLNQRGLPCQYLDAGKCKISSRHQKGWSCKANLKIRPHFETRAKIQITPKKPTHYMEDGMPDDFSFSYSFNQMYRMCFWDKTKK